MLNACRSGDMGPPAVATAHPLVPAQRVREAFPARITHITKLNPPAQ